MNFESWWNVVGSGITPKEGHDYEDHAKRVAKAAWVAAAPNDLLKALEGLLNALPSATTHPAIQTARAAIAKAKGGSA